MSMQRHTGFTLLELLITVCILTILMAVAVPSFDIVNNRLIAQSQVENLQRTLSMARQTAIAKNRPAIVCPSSNGNSCTTDEDWSYGYMVYIDRNGNNAFNAAEDQLIEYVTGVRNVATRQDTSGFAHKLTSNRNLLKFSPQGDAIGYTQTFTYCDANQHAKFALVVSNEGRIRVNSLKNVSCS
jgi:type IV fimbrial biogenesis protein FimT